MLRRPNEYLFSVSFFPGQIRLELTTSEKTQDSCFRSRKKFPLFLICYATVISHPLICLPRTLSIAKNVSPCSLTDSASYTGGDGFAPTDGNTMGVLQMVIAACLVAWLVIVILIS